MLSLNISEVVVGHSLEAVRYAHENKLSLILNSEFKNHSYEPVTDEITEKVWQMSMNGQLPFSRIPASIKLRDELTVLHARSKTKIECSKVHLFSLENVETSLFDYEVSHYRVLDWFDAYGQTELLEGRYPGGEKVCNIQTFPTTRLDQKNSKRDIFVEQKLAAKDLQDPTYSDTVVRQKLQKMLSESNLDLKLRLWKRDVYPIEKTFHYVVEL